MKSLKGEADLFELRPKQGLARLGRFMRGSAAGSWFWR
jgi:hypothetical protein